MLLDRNVLSSPSGCVCHRCIDGMSEDRSYQYTGPLFCGRAVLCLQFTQPARTALLAKPAIYHHHLGIRRALERKATLSMRQHWRYLAC